MTEEINTASDAQVPVASPEQTPPESPDVVASLFSDEEKGLLKSLLGELRINPSDADAEKTVALVKGLVAKL